MLELRNPHSVLAAIQRRPRDVVEVRIGSHGPSGAWDDVVAAAKAERIPVVQGHIPDRGPRSGPKTERESAALAKVKEHPGVDTIEMLFDADQVARGGLWIALDCLQDPHNVGAIFRSAGFFGVRGIIVSRDRSAPINGTVHDVSAGGLESVPFCQVSNMAHALEVAKAAGLWMLGTSEHATVPFSKIGPDRPWVLVLGNEEKGLRRLTQDKCDVISAIPSRGGVTSLNVSVAAAVFISKLTGPLTD